MKLKFWFVKLFDYEWKLCIGTTAENAAKSGYGFYCNCMSIAGPFETFHK